MYQGQRPSRHIKRVHTRHGVQYRGVNPEISPRRKVVFDKNTTNKQYKKKLKLVESSADADGDGVKNEKDCRPFDSSRQDSWETSPGIYVDTFDETPDSQFEYYETNENPHSSSAGIESEMRK